MNTTRGYAVVIQCVKCPNVYMRVKETSIGLAQPRRVSTDQYGQDMKGTCPAHGR